MYLIGPLELLKEQFPTDDFSHVRTSLDGINAVIEKQLTDDMQKDLTALKIQIYNHEDVIALLNGPSSSGIWYTPESEEAQ
jgi:hypothetical protein